MYLKLGYYGSGDVFESSEVKPGDYDLCQNWIEVSDSEYSEWVYINVKLEAFVKLFQKRQEARLCSTRNKEE